MVYIQPKGKNPGVSSVVGSNIASKFDLGSTTNKPNINLNVGSSNFRRGGYKSGNLLKNLAVGGIGFTGGFLSNIKNIKQHSQVARLGKDICMGSKCPSVRAAGPGAYGGVSYIEASKKLGLKEVIKAPNPKRELMKGIGRGFAGAAISTGLNLGLKAIQKKRPGFLSSFTFR
tara:strand:- start:76 stop:594 length:519 start_codon:yes stop_codon:yes gene_type:complete